MDIDTGECQYCGGRYKLGRGGLVHHERACLRNQEQETELANTMAQIRLEHKGTLNHMLYTHGAHDSEPGSISTTARK
jgi:hypothetical protein